MLLMISQGKTIVFFFRFSGCHSRLRFGFIFQLNPSFNGRFSMFCDQSPVSKMFLHWKLEQFCIILQGGNSRQFFFCFFRWVYSHWTLLPFLVILLLELWCASYDFARENDSFFFFRFSGFHSRLRF